jgi:nickel/cobalt transporter (NiCoT) family protein
MYPIGFLFGLGFDTSSEIALLGLSSIQAAKGTSVWLILIFPALFTAGMCLLDTTDGALMMALYTKTADSRNPFIILYSSIVLTTVTVTVAFVVGFIQILTLAVSVSNAQGGFADAINAIQDNWDIFGNDSVFFNAECG